jgi:tetratricopeptide (TPR) repeat protein
MADEEKTDEASESVKPDDIAASKASLKPEREAAGAKNADLEQPKSGGSLADAQQQRYLNRALNRSTQTNLSKFTANRLEAVQSPTDNGDGDSQQPKIESNKEVFEKQRSAETEAAPGKKHPYLGITALICSIGVAGYLYFFMQNKGDVFKNPAALNQSSSGAEVKSDGAHGAFYLNRAELNMRASNYRKALADLKLARQRDPANQTIYLEKMGECLSRLKDYKGAMSISTTLLALQPNNVTGLLEHAQASYLLGNKLSARNDLFKAIQLAPTNAEAFLARGSYYIAEKQFSSAEPDFKQALSLDPKIIGAKEKLAAAQAAQKVGAPRIRSKALAVATSGNAELPALTQAELQQLKSSDLNTLRQAGLQAMTHKRYEFAVAALKRCVIINPNDPQSRKLLAYALINAGDANGAFDQFNAWDSIVGLGLEEQLTFGRALTKAGDTQTTSAFFNFLVDDSSTNAQNLLRIAQAADRAGCSSAVDKAVSLGLKLSAGTLRYQFLVLMRKVQTGQIGTDSSDVVSRPSREPVGR